MPERATKVVQLFVLQSIMPSNGWRAVYWDEQTHGHVLGAVHALALAYQRMVESVSGRRLTDPPYTEDEASTIVGLEYDATEGWVIVEDVDNYCGLLPPDQGLADFDCPVPHVRVPPP